MVGAGHERHSIRNGHAKTNSELQTLQDHEDKSDDDDVEKNAHHSKEDIMSLGNAEDPKKWSYAYKWTVTGLVGSAGFVVAWASAVDSEVSPQIMQEFGVGQEVALLGTSLFMVTFGLGSLISAPFSEVVWTIQSLRIGRHLSERLTVFCRLVGIRYISLVSLRRRV